MWKDARSRVRGSDHHPGFSGPYFRRQAFGVICLSKDFVHQCPVFRWNRDSRELLVLRCLSNTCTRCRSVKCLRRKVCWVQPICLSGEELGSLSKISVAVVRSCAVLQWFRDSPARFWYFVADHIDEFVVRRAQRAAVRKNVDFFLRKLQLPGLSVPVPSSWRDVVVEKEELGAVCCESGTTVPCAAGLQGLLELSDTSD